MSEIENVLRLDVELMVNQLTKTTDRFGIHLGSLIREGVANKLLLWVVFELIRDTGGTTKEVHAKFAVQIEYKSDGGVEFRVRWRADDSGGSSGVESALCDNFSGVITQLLQLAANAPGCSWTNAIAAKITPAGDAFCQKHGYTESRDSTQYIDATNPVGPDIPNSVCSGLTAHVHASNAFMDKSLR